MLCEDLGKRMSRAKNIVWVSLAGNNPRLQESGPRLGSADQLPIVRCGISRGY